MPVVVVVARLHAAATSGAARLLAGPSGCCAPAAAPRAPRAARLAVRAGDGSGHMLGGDFGARDPTPGELASNFSDKVLGNWDTEHVIKPPEAMAKYTGLAARRCVPCEGGAAPLGEKDVALLRNQCPGWRLAKTEAGADAIACAWTALDAPAARALMGRIGEVAEAEGHHPDLHLTGDARVEAVLTTHAAGGLTENDFILAAKINALDLKDLLPKPKQRFWA